MWQEHLEGTRRTKLSVVAIVGRFTSCPLPSHALGKSACLVVHAMCRPVRAARHICVRADRHMLNMLRCAAIRGTGAGSS